MFQGFDLEVLYCILLVYETWMLESRQSHINNTQVSGQQHIYQEVHTLINI